MWCACMHRFASRVRRTRARLHAVLAAVFEAQSLGVELVNRKDHSSCFPNLIFEACCKGPGAAKRLMSAKYPGVLFRVHVSANAHPCL